MMYCSIGAPVSIRYTLETMVAESSEQLLVSQLSASSIKINNTQLNGLLLFD